MLFRSLIGAIMMAALSMLRSRGRRRSPTGDPDAMTAPGQPPIPACPPICNSAQTR
jgi:hypothetical protein